MTLMASMASMASMAFKASEVYWADANFDETILG